MRTTSLSDEELEALLAGPALDRRDLRAQAVVSLIADAGVHPRELAALSTLGAMRLLREGQGGQALPERPARLLGLLLDAVGEQAHLLGPKPLQAPGLRWLCRRYGTSRGVGEVIPERLRRTWVRREVEAIGLGAAAARAGVSERTLRRQLREDMRASGAGLSPPPPMGAASSEAVRV